MKKKIIVISLLILILVILVLVVGTIGSNRCSLYIDGIGRGTFIEVSFYTCSYLEESCQKFIEDGYACELNKSPVSLRKYECTCQIRYGQFDEHIDWRK